MSPEQARGQAVDHRSDVFSLAAIAYRALTGHPPFSGPDQLSIMYQVCNQQPFRPSLPGAPSPDVEAVLAVGLAKQRDRRFASARELASALQDAAASKLGADIHRRAAGILDREPWRGVGADQDTLDDGTGMSGRRSTE
jgi:serine/threonine-protein kinase